MERKIPSQTRPLHSHKYSQCGRLLEYVYVGLRPVVFVDRPFTVNSFAEVSNLASQQLFVDLEEFVQLCEVVGRLHT